VVVGGDLRGEVRAGRQRDGDKQEADEMSGDDADAPAGKRRVEAICASRRRSMISFRLMPKP